MLTSKSQQRIYYAEQKLSNGYNLRISISTHDLGISQFNLKVVEEILSRLLKRHTQLASTFFIQNNELKLHHNPNLIPTIQKGNSTLTIQSLMLHSISSSLLFQTHIVSNESHETLFFIFHHIIFDGWSSIVFKSEFVSLYQQIITNSTLLLPDLHYTYQDYCKWEQDYLLSLRFQKSLSWWKDQCISSFHNDFPYDSLMPSSNYSSLYIQSITHPDILSKWKMLRETYKISMLSLFQTFLTITFSLITSQKKILLNGVTSNRPNFQSEKIIGMFVNTIAYPYTLNDTDTLEQIIMYSKKLFFQVLTHSQVPYEFISSTPPQIVVTTNLENSMQDFSASKNNSTFSKFAGKFDLRATIEHVNQQLNMKWIYREGLFTEDTIIKFSHVFEQVLLLSTPNTIMSALKHEIDFSGLFPSYTRSKIRNNEI